MNATTQADTHPERPKALSVIVKNIPIELRALIQWVCWRYRLTKDGKWTKVPYTEKNAPASSTDSQTWTTVSRVEDAYKTGRFDGIGVVVTADDSFIGIDLDHCFDPTTRKGEQWAIDVIQEMRSYSEFSPSGEGIRIFVMGKLPAGISGKKKGNIEIYSANRYLTVTGHRLKNAPETIESRQNEINEFYQKIFGKEPATKIASNGHGEWTDDDLIAKAFAAKNGEKIQALFAGDVSDYPSQSEADLALCSMLAFWAADEAQLDRLFRQSALMRGKWDENHGGQTYGVWTIQKAFAGRNGRYDPLADRPEKRTPAEEKKPKELVRNEFPQEAWIGLFATWREVIGPRTEAPLEFLWASFLLACGMILGRRVWRESPREIYPNFYVLMLGPTGDSRKSTALNYACDLLDHCGEDFKVLRGVVSSEGIYEALSDHAETKALIQADEFRALLSIAQRKGTQDIIPKLNSLYYSPERDSIDRVKDSTAIVKPFVSLISSSPREYIEDILTGLEIDGGFLNRFLVISGEEQNPKSLAKRLPPIPWEKFTVPLTQVDHAGHLDFTENAAEMYDGWYIKWRSERKSWPYKQAHLTARVFEHILKISTVYAVILGESQISIRTLAIGIAIGEWLQSSALYMFEAVGIDRFGKCEFRILEALKTAKDNRMWRRELQQRMGRYGFNGEIFNRAIKALESNEHVRCYPVTTAAGRVRQVVELSV